MKPECFHLMIADDTRTLELHYGGDENLIIECNVPQREEELLIEFPFHVLEKFIDIIRESKAGKNED